MATIDDLQEQGTVRAIIEDRDTPTGMVEEVRIILTVPQALLNTIAGGDTRSRVMVQDWIKVAMDAALND